MLGQVGADHGLRPVMTLSSSLIAIKPLKAGETVGYGATWRSPRNTVIGVAAIGYGDGYVYAPSTDEGDAVPSDTPAAEAPATEESAPVDEATADKEPSTTEETPTIKEDEEADAPEPVDD